jgi:hypothetical protein
VLRSRDPRSERAPEKPEGHRSVTPRPSYDPGSIGAPRNERITVHQIIVVLCGTVKRPQETEARSRDGSCWIIAIQDRRSSVRSKGRKVLYKL